jgi:hypothetical protein
LRYRHRIAELEPNPVVDTRDDGGKEVDNERKSQGKVRMLTFSSEPTSPAINPRCGIRNGKD